MKNTKLFYWPILALFTLFMVSCGSDKKEEVKEDDSGISINVDGGDGKANIKIGEDGIKIDVNDGDGAININTKDLEEGMSKLFVLITILAVLFMSLTISLLCLLLQV